MLFVPELKVEGEQSHLQLIHNHQNHFECISELFNIARNFLSETRKRNFQNLQVVTILKEISLGLSSENLRALKREFFSNCVKKSTSVWFHAKKLSFLLSASVHHKNPEHYFLMHSIYQKTSHLDFSRAHIHKTHEKNEKCLLDF